MVERLLVSVPLFLPMSDPGPRFPVPRSSAGTRRGFRAPMADSECLTGTGLPGQGSSAAESQAADASSPWGTPFCPGQAWKRTTGHSTHRL